MKAIDRTPEPGDVIVRLNDEHMGLGVVDKPEYESDTYSPGFFCGTEMYVVPPDYTSYRSLVTGVNLRGAYGLDNRQVVVIPRSLIKQLLEVKNRELDEQQARERELARQIIDAANRAGDPEETLSPSTHQSSVPSAQSAQAGSEGSRGGGQAAQVPAEAPSNGNVYPLPAAGDSAAGR